MITNKDILKFVLEVCKITTIVVAVFVAFFLFISVIELAPIPILAVLIIVSIIVYFVDDHLFYKSPTDSNSRQNV